MKRLTPSRLRTVAMTLNHRSGHRRGAMAILVIFMLFVFMMIAAFTIDHSYMQLVRAELRVATDAAAKAGAEALARTENRDAAIDRALLVASSNLVGGSQLQLRREDVVLGRVTEGSNGRWQFQAGASPFNSVQVNSNAQPSLFFGGIHGRDNFRPVHAAIAGQQQVDVCLCLDRSGSMLFDMSGRDWVYPPNNPQLSNFTAWGEMWQYHLSPPHPQHSRWAVLARAVEDFFREMQQLTPPPSVSLVSWGSDYTMPIAPSTRFPAARTDVPLQTNTPFVAQRDRITGAIDEMGSQPMMGATNLSAGLDRAVAELTGPNGRTLTNKVVLLLTDGMWNDGRHPLVAGAAARNAGVTVHTVTMLTAFQQDIRQLAEMTGGMSFTTINEEQLRQAFREVARSLQVVMIE
jgi:Ca-activated chloride channel family protein